MNCKPSACALPTLALAAMALLPAAATRAGPAAYIPSPIVVQGEREIELKAGSVRLRDGSQEGQQQLSLAYSATAWWLTELTVGWHKPAGERHSFDAWEWENRFQLTETGRYPVDLGLLVEIERPRDRREGYELVWGPMVQADLSSQVQANFNLRLGRHLRAEQGAAAELGYQWQLKYRWQPAIEIGLQGLGEVGPWRHWLPASQQSHSVGPALFGKLRLGERQSIKYDTALLFGQGPGAARETLRLKLEYEF